MHTFLRSIRLLLLYPRGKWKFLAHAWILLVKFCPELTEKKKRINLSPFSGFYTRTIEPTRICMSIYGAFFFFCVVASGGENFLNLALGLVQRNINFGSREKREKLFFYIKIRKKEKIIIILLTIHFLDCQKKNNEHGWILNNDILYNILSQCPYTHYLRTRDTRFGCWQPNWIERKVQNKFSGYVLSGYKHTRSQVARTKKSDLIYTTFLVKNKNKKNKKLSRSFSLCSCTGHHCQIVKYLIRNWCCPAHYYVSNNLGEAFFFSLSLRSLPTSCLCQNKPK